jgi:hypothetical protein
VLHATGESLERGEAGPKKNEISDDQRNEPCHDNRRLERPNWIIDLDGGKEQEKRWDQKQRRVDAKNAPKERHALIVTALRQAR